MIKIYTLGNFDIKSQDISILGFIKDKTKLLKLFKYFITFQGKKLLPDKIIEDLLQDYEDPLNVLRTQVSRLRHLFIIKDNEIKPFFEIKYIDGYYLFNLSKDCSLDYLEMETYIKEYQGTMDNEKAIGWATKIINLYKGEYLDGLNCDDWVIPIRSRFNRLFISGLTKYLQLLKELSMHNRIVCLCEDIMFQFPYEEIININYMESLVNLGQITSALSHYIYYTSKMYNELGTAPSSKMLSLYKTIRFKEEHMCSNINLNNIDKELKDCDDYHGALFCDNCYFKFLYNFKKRKKDRDDERIFVGIITIDKIGYSSLSPEDAKSYMKVLLDIIKYDLRKGDTVSQWNGNQVLLMLLELGEENLDLLIDRFKETFRIMVKNEKILLNAKFQKI